jgi:hypothetical protein
MSESARGTTPHRLLVVEDDAARPYKAPLSLAETLDILTRETEAGAWDPRVVVVLPEVLRELPEVGTGDARMPGGMGPGA